MASTGDQEFFERKVTEVTVPNSAAAPTPAIVQPVVVAAVGPPAQQPVITSITSTEVHPDPPHRCCYCCHCPMCVLIVLSFLLPPLAVGLHSGACTRFWCVSIILMFMFWIPGVIFAILVVTNRIKMDDQDGSRGRGSRTVTTVRRTPTV